MYRSRSGSYQPEPLSIDEPEGVKKGNGKTKKVISKKTPKRRSCNLIALQWARGAKWFSLQVLQWAQGAKEDRVCESKKLKCHVFWFGCEPECLNCLLCLCEENLDVGVYVCMWTSYLCVDVNLDGCLWTWMLVYIITCNLLISCYCGCSFKFVCLIILVQK